MPILETDEYEELLDAQEKKEPRNEEFKAGEGEALIGFTAFISRDSLSEIADEIGLDQEAWNENFRYSEEWEIEAIVDMETGEIIKARLV